MASESLPESTAQPYRLIASPWHTLLVLAVELLIAYRGVLRAANARAGLGVTRPRMYLRTMLVELLVLALVVLGLKLRGTPCHGAYVGAQ